MSVASNPAWEKIIFDRATPTLEPCQQAAPSVRQKLELDWAAGLLLHDKCAGTNLSAAGRVITRENVGVVSYSASVLEPALHPRSFRHSKPGAW
jgi:hypothetical protein